KGFPLVRPRSPAPRPPRHPWRTLRVDTFQSSGDAGPVVVCPPRCRGASVSAPENAKRPAGINDVAARAGVSAATVSNVLNRPERVAEATRLRVEQAIRELDYVRDSSGRSLRAGRSDSVGLLVLDVTNPFFTTVALGVEDQAAEYGLTVMLLNSAESPERQRRSLRVPAGAVVLPVDGDFTDLLWLRERGIPWVLLDRGDVATEAGSSVCVDHRVGALAAGRHLVGLGHERIAFVSGPPALEQCRVRLAGLRDTLAENGVTAEDAVRVVHTPSLTADSGEKAVDELRAAAPAAARRRCSAPTTSSRSACSRGWAPGAERARGPVGGGLRRHRRGRPGPSRADHRRPARLRDRPGGDASAGGRDRRPRPPPRTPGV